MLTICEVPGCPGGFLFSGTSPPQGLQVLERRGGGEKRLVKCKGRGDAGNVRGRWEEGEKDRWINQTSNKTKTEEIDSY